uniref:Actin maturation protease n=1 Tax=Cuerna arida TaxID=1464854 RepID=A0A1B6G7J7_9HEMI
MASVPPPPPPLPVTTNQDCKSENGLMGEIGEESFNKCLCDLNVYVKKTITRIRPISQTGPNCGLTALAMVSSLTPCPLSIPQIFEEASNRGFTNHGEMFSALNMKNLADNILSPWFKVDLFTDGLEANKAHVIDRLHNGDLMLVPYPLLD